MKQKKQYTTLIVLPNNALSFSPIKGESFLSFNSQPPYCSNVLTSHYCYKDNLQVLTMNNKGKNFYSNLYIANTIEDAKHTI